MLRFRSASILNFALVVALTGCAWSGVVARSSPPLEVVPPQQLAAIFGADQSQSANVTGDCDSNYANKNQTAGCDSCTTDQANAQKQCACCDGGGAIDMSLNNPGIPGTFSGIDRNAESKFNCGNVSLARCVRLGNRAMCDDTPVITDLSCGTVTEYSN